MVVHRTERYARQALKNNLDILGTKEESAVARHRKTDMKKVMHHL